LHLQSSAIASYLLGFVVALLASLGLTYVVRGQARRFGLFDATDDRKVHTGAIPRVGGIAIVAACAISLGVFYLLSAGHPLGDDRFLWTFDGSGLARVLIGGGAMFLIGLWDDLRPLRARYKFLAQIAVAVAVFASGVRVTAVSVPFVGAAHFGTAIALVCTVVWLVGLTNAFNLIDGLDGLASGAALFALTTMFVVGNLNGQSGFSLVTIVVAGATLGFLFFNFNPASIFLGDSGSLFLGFMLAGLGLLSSQKSQTIVAVAIPVLSLGLPVLDTSLAIIRRFLRGQPIFSADRGHIHHRLLGLGHSPRKVALLLYGVCAAMAFAAMLLVNHSQYIALVLVLCGVGVCVAVQRLRFQEFEELGRIMRKSMRQREAIGRSVRIREVSQALALRGDLGQVFDDLERIFAADDFERVEVRLRPAFITGDRSDLVLARRGVDDVTVWAWAAGASMPSGTWEIRLPLLDAHGDRIGALALWQDGSENDLSLAHLPTIARDLRVVVQQKVETLWHASGLVAPAALHEVAPEVQPRERAPRTPPELRRVTGEGVALRDADGSRTSAA